MKKFLSLLLLLGILHVPFLAQAQTTTYTPQLHLALPPAAPGTWGEQYNNNFSTLDSAITGTFGTAIAFSGDLTPAQITADQTDYNPTGLSTANVLRLSSDAARSINSLAGGSDGRTIILYNVGTQQITLKNNSGIGSAANQFLLNADVVLGINQGAIVQYDATSARWRVASSIGSTGVGSAHVIQDETSNLTARPTLNFTGAGVTCTDNSGSNRTDCTVPGGSTDVAAAYTWTGVHSWRDGNFSLLNTGDTSKILKFDLSGFTASTTRTMTLPDASTRLLGDSDVSTTGLVTRTAANTYAGRTLGITAGSNNYLAWTNGNGVSGNPTIGLGANVLTNDRSATISTGDYDFAAASSFKIPVATGAAPTVSGRIAYDSTANRYKFGVNGSTITIPSLAEIQPLNANLTALAGLTGAASRLPYFTAASTMAVATLIPCTDTGGNHLNISSLSPLTFQCGTSSTGGLVGATPGKYLFATGATTYDTSGSLSESGGVVSMTGLNVGSGFKLILDPSAIAGSDKTWTVLNFSGTIRPSTGALTAGNIVTVNANGLLVDGGAPGVGTWTDSSSSTGTNKTLVATQAGGTNTITTGINAYFDAASVTPDVSANCALQTAAAIGTGPIVPVMTCADSDSSTFDGQIAIPNVVTTITFTLSVTDVDSSAQHFAGTFKAMCRRGASGDTIDNTWGTGQTVDITMTTADKIYSGTTAAVTPNGTCAAGATLFWRFTVAGSTTNTDGGNARILGVLLKQAS